MRASRGQAAPLLAGAALALLVAVGVLGAFGRVLLARADDQRAADLAAASAARSMRDDFSRLFAPSTGPDGRPNPSHLDKRQYLERARAAAIEIARANGAMRAPAVTFPDGGSFAPLRVRVRLTERVGARRGDGGRRGIWLRSGAEAELLPPSGADADPWARRPPTAGSSATPPASASGAGVPGSRGTMRLHLAVY